MAVFIASWESNPVERTVVSCVIGVVCVRGRARRRSQCREGARSRRARGGDDLRVCVWIRSRGGRKQHDARSYVGGGMAEQAEFSTSENVTSLDTKRILLNIVDSINKS